MILFYSTEIHDEKITLSKEEARHCTQVLRKKIGDIIQIVDGKGGYHTVELIEIQKKYAVTKILETKKAFLSTPTTLHIGIAPTKNISRFEWFLEKATEIGIQEITPILCQRSERKHLRQERLEKILVAAMKQSVKAYLPKLNPIMRLDEFVDLQINAAKFIAHCAEKSGNHFLRDNYKAGQNVCILIGPEGDFSQEEIALARENGFQEISLGKSRLRTETAGIVACHTINLLND